MPLINCTICNKEVEKEQRYINRAIKNGWRQVCSNECKHLLRKTAITTNCSQCNKVIEKQVNVYNKSKNMFCNRSCRTRYQNSHKTTGTRVSKLEKYLQLRLKELYPSLDFIFNSSTIVGLELDIYIPSLKLAFELNGIFHYEPIFGNDKLSRTQFNDNQKYQACISKNISLCVIDTSGQKYVKESTSQKYIDIIVSIINKSRED